MTLIIVIYDGNLQESIQMPSAYSGLNSSSIFVSQLGTHDQVVFLVQNLVSYLGCQMRVPKFFISTTDFYTYPVKSFTNNRIPPPLNISQKG